MWGHEKEQFLLTGPLSLFLDGSQMPAAEKSIGISIID
jgi:hypothetical protein